MADNSKRSAACCTRPPFQLPDLPLHGDFADVAGIETYVTGPSSARHGIFVVYDIFGRFPQTLYGADILAHGKDEADSAVTKYQVFVPDFYGSEASEYSWYPPTTKEKQDALNKFFSGPADITSVNAKLKLSWKALAQDHPEIEDWAIVGYCYGGEIAQYIMGDMAASWSEVIGDSVQGLQHPFKAAVLLHSGFFEDEELAKRLKVPILVLNSGEENEQDMEIFLKGTSTVGTKVEVHWFRDMVHGWMAARGDLSDENVMKDFLTGYQVVRDFLEKSL